MVPRRLEYSSTVRPIHERRMTVWAVSPYWYFYLRNMMARLARCMSQPANSQAAVKSHVSVRSRLLLALLYRPSLLGRFLKAVFLRYVGLVLDPELRL